MKLNKKQVELPTRLTGLAKKNSESFQFGSYDAPVLIKDAQVFIDMFMEEFNSLPHSQSFQLISLEAFRDLDPLGQNVQLFSDLAEMVLMMRTMAANRICELLLSFLRAARAEEVFTMANLGRAILESGVVFADVVKGMLVVFQFLAEKPQGTMPRFSDERVERETLLKWETELYKGIFGSRIGTGNIGDNRKTSIWPDTGTDEEQTISINIMTHFQGRAKRNKENSIGKLAVDDMRMYEILCDIVHPSALGYSPFFREIEVSEGMHSYKIEKGIKNKETRGTIACASLFGVAHGIGLFVELNREINKYEVKAKASLRDMFDLIDKSPDKPS